MPARRHEDPALYARVVVLDWPASRGLEVLKVLIDPTADLAHPLMGPFSARRDGAGPVAEAAVKLAKLAGLLPAAVVRPSRSMRPRGLRRRKAGTRGRSARSPPMMRRAPPRSSQSPARACRSRGRGLRGLCFPGLRRGPEHLAILVGSPSPPGPVLARLHSECFTGDLSGSLKCDCGDQLKARSG